MERIKNEHIKEIIVVKEKPDIIERKRLQWYGHVKRMPEERIPQLIMEWTYMNRSREQWLALANAIGFHIRRELA
jgi:hypothetical protein